MRKLSKTQSSRKAELVTELQDYREKLETAINTYNEKLQEVTDFEELAEEPGYC